MRLSIAVLAVFGLLFVSQVFAVTVPIKRYESSPTMFDPDAAVLDYFQWGTLTTQAEILEGDNSPGYDESYDVPSGNPATGTKVVLDVAGISPFDPALSSLSFDVQWNIPGPSGATWDNGFRDYFVILDMAGQSLGPFGQFTADGFFGCSPDNLPCGSSVVIPDLTIYTNSMADEVEVVIDYYDGDRNHQLVQAGGVAPFTISNFDLVVPEPTSLNMVFMSLLAAMFQLLRPNRR